MSFRNDLVILEATVAVFCRDMLLMQNLSSQNKLDFWLVILHRKELLHLVKTYFSMNPSFRLVETYFLSRRKSVLLFRAFFLLLETMIEVMRNQF